MYLENINSPADVKAVGIDKLDILAGEVRKHLLQKLSDHGGHIGPNLGMVEATVALHYVFNSPIDKMVFDVSHQSYAHKMLTGRKDAFLNPAEYDEVSGYTEPSESEHDQFVVGHTSTSVSLACGLAKGRDLKGGKENVIAVIGDGSLSGGEALEGLDMAAELDTNIIIVVNDNQMSIAENHGGLYKNLQLLRETNGGAQCNLFKAMGLDYVYVGEGNNVKALVEAFQKVKDTTRPVVVHINTVKGKGYKFAEEQKERFHWGFPFVIETGETKKEYQFGPDFGVHTAQMLLDEMQKDPAVVALTAGTPGIWGWNAEMRQKAGKQFVDVGIAEETAVAMSSAMAKRGAKPVFGVHSSFIQRTYDQLSQDLCINNNAASIIVFGGTITGLNDVTPTSGSTTSRCFATSPTWCISPPPARRNTTPCCAGRYTRRNIPWQYECRTFRSKPPTTPLRRRATATLTAIRLRTRAAKLPYSGLAATTRSRKKWRRNTRKKALTQP